MLSRSAFSSIVSICLIAIAAMAPGLSRAEWTPLPENAEELDRQLTVMAIRARKGEMATDPRLMNVESRLAQLLPDHAFALWDGRSRPVKENGSLVMDLKNGMKLTIRLIESENPEGKVRMEVRLESGANVVLKSTIRTPPNQLFFLDHKIDEDEHLLIAVGAR